MVEVTVRYFANLRDALGTSSETYQLATASLVALRAEQQARHGAAADELGTNGVKVALNQGYEVAEHILGELGGPAKDGGDVLDVLVVRPHAVARHLGPQLVVLGEAGLRVVGDIHR